MSKGCEELLGLVQSIFPNQTIILEHNIASNGGLFLDIYLPKLSLAFEFDGMQHFTYSQHFHGSPDAFRAAKKRDLAKTNKCKELGISLVRVRYDESMTKELVLDKIMKALEEVNND